MTNLANLHEYSLLRGISYSPKRYAIDQFVSMGYELVYYYNKQGIQAFLIMKDEQMYLVIRGTDEFRDWLRNANVNTIKGVYAGPIRSYYHLRELVEDSCIVMGHSLGGAIASLFENNERYSFGAPKVHSIIKNAKHYTRVTNCNDIAPKLPFNFKHPRCIHLHLTYSGSIIENPSYWTILSDRIRGRLRAWGKGEVFSGVYDHQLGRYQNKLAKLI